MQLIFKNTVDEFVEYCMTEYKTEKTRHGDEFWGINIVAHYEVIIPILNALLKNYDVDLCGGELHSYEYRHYEREFILCIDADGGIWVEAVYNPEKERYLMVGNGLTFVHGDCSSNFATVNDTTPMIMFAIGEIEDEGFDEEYDDDEDEIDLADAHEMGFDDEYDDEDEEDDEDEDDDDTTGDTNYQIDIQRDEDGRATGFSQSFMDDDRYISRSFYSTDRKLVEAMLKIWSE